MGLAEANCEYYQEDESEAVRRAKRKLAQELESKGDNNGKRRKQWYFDRLFKKELRLVERERKIKENFCRRYNERRKKAAGVLEHV